MIDPLTNPTRKAELLAYLKQSLEAFHRARHALEEKAKFVLTAGSVVITFPSALLIDTIQDGNIPMAVLIPFAAVVLMSYFAMAHCALRTFRLAPFFLPVNANWHELMSYVPLNDDEFMDQLIQQHIGVIEENRTVNQQKARCVTAAMRLFALTSALMFLAAVAVSLSAALGN